MPDVVVHVGCVGDSELVIVGLWYLILLMGMSLPMLKHCLTLETGTGGRAREWGKLF